MPTQRVFWSPSSNASVVTYKVYSAASAAQLAQNPQGLASSLALLAFQPGALALLGLVPVDPTGPNFDAPSGRYFWDDPAGTPITVYAVQGLGPDQTVVADSGVFQLQQVQAANLITRVMVDHNYGGLDALRYVAPNGTPIPNATIQAYKLPDFLAGRYDLAYAATTTDSDGRFSVPLFLEAGMTWTLVFSVYGMFGPTRFDVIV